MPVSMSFSELCSDQGGSIYSVGTDASNVEYVIIKGYSEGRGVDGCPGYSLLILYII